MHLVVLSKEGSPMYETNSWDDNDVISKSLKIIACLFV